MFTALFFILVFILSVWVYRSIRSLSELSQAPILKLSAENTRNGKVTVLIPAKNEEKNIENCVRPFLEQLREGDEIIVVNNCSEDKTEQILKELGASEIPFGGTPKDPAASLKYLNTPKTPDGWTGKNFALHLGIFYASGDWLLFTDADTRHQIGSLNAAISFAEKNRLDFLTLFPRCLAHGFWENLIQPCAMGYMGLWFPIRKVNDPASNVYFGNGQYLLIKHEHYQRIGGHAEVKEAFLEDFAMMKKTKECGARGMCGFGMDVYGTRMYDSFDSLWKGWRRIFLHAFEQKPMRILNAATSVLCFSVLPFFLAILAFKNNSLMLDLTAFLTLGIILATAFKTHAIVKARKSAAIFHPLAAAVFFLILLDALRIAVLKRPTYWR